MSTEVRSSKQQLSDEDLQELIDYVVPCRSHDAFIELQQARAEIERLRAALEVLKAELPDSSQIIQAVLDGMHLRPADETTHD